MSDRKEPAPVETPRIAVEALALAKDGVRVTHDNSYPDAMAQVSSAASLLMIAELLQHLLNEARQLRGILCTRKPPL